VIRSKEFLIGEEWDDVYLLPLAAFKVWWFHYRCEWEDRNSWPGESTIRKKLNINRKTLYSARKWLIEHGWLVQTSGAYRKHNPTFRVERGWIPGKKCQIHASPILGCVECVPKKASLKLGRQGYGSGSVSGSASDFDSASTSPSIRDGGSVRGAVVATPQSVREVKDESPNHKPKIRKPKAAADGTIRPKNFDSWTNAERLQWIEDHKVSEAFGAKKKPDQNRPPLAARAKAAAVDQPPGGANPPANCTACSFDDDPGKENRDGLCINCWDEKKIKGQI
jgi:hypothetical protein